MKVSVTFEIDDEQRLVLGIQANGELAPATREEMETAIKGYVSAPLEAGVVALRQANQQMIREFTAIRGLNEVMDTPES